MSSPSQIAANRVNAEASTGPRSEAGKAASSQNALAFGLFSTRDFVRSDEREEHARLCAGLWHELSPEGVLEQSFALEIVSATWRLRRCGVVEADLADRFFADPMSHEEEASARIQTSVDRARSHAHNVLRKSLAELRRLQTERAIRDELEIDRPALTLPALASSKQVISTLNQNARRKSLAARVDELDRFEAAIDAARGIEAVRPAAVSPTAATPGSGLASFCKTDEAVPRNAPCPCRSGLKYKRCCGRNAPALLQNAA